MAENETRAKVRQWIDTNNAKYGIDWREVSKWLGNSPTEVLTTDIANGLYDKYGMDRDTANRYARAVQSFRATELADPNDLNLVGRREEGLRLTLKDLEANPAAPLEPQGPTGPSPEEVERKRLTDWITKFTQDLGRPLDMNDPVFASLTNMGASRASQNVGASGVRVGRGGLGELAIQQGAYAATVPYVQRRQEMLQQGLGMLDGRERGIEALKQGAYSLDLQRQNMQNQNNLQMYGQQADAAGGTGGFIGGALGALGGGILTAATGGAAAPAIPGLIAGGASIGSGVGMQSVPRPNYGTPQRYGSFGNRSGGYI